MSGEELYKANLEWVWVAYPYDQWAYDKMNGWVNPEDDPASPTETVLLDEIKRLRAEHTFVERLVAGQLSARMTELEADLTAERAEVERLRAAGDALYYGVGPERDVLRQWREARQ